MARVKRRKISHVVQAKKLEKSFSSGTMTVGHNGFIWTSSMQPTPLSDTYAIKLRYRLEKHPDIFVLNRLKLAKGKTRLPHVYSTDKQHLCLYHRRAGQWNSGMLISDTIIPWINEWLYFYELWLIDGKWYGGGIDHGKKKPYIKSIQK